MSRALQPAQTAIASRDVAGARTALDALQADLANEPAFKKLRADLDATTNAVAKKVRLDAVLGRFDQQIAAGQLLEPAQNNARESLGSAQVIDPQSPDVARRRSELATSGDCGSITCAEPRKRSTSRRRRSACNPTSRAPIRSSAPRKASSAPRARS